MKTILWVNDNFPKRIVEIPTQQFKKRNDYMKQLGLSLRKCNNEDLKSILQLQNYVFERLDNPAILRRNTEHILSQCLVEPSFTIGVYNKNELIGTIIMVVPSGDETDLRVNLKLHTVHNAADFKLVMIKEEYRGHGLQCALMWVMEKIAFIRGYEYLCVSVSPENLYSRRNITRSGYEFDHSEVLYGGLDREIYVKELNVNKYNLEVIRTANNFEGKDKQLRDIDLSNCIIGTIEIASTGDILEYRDPISGNSYWGLFIKRISPFVLLYDVNRKIWSVFDYNDTINGLELTNVWINTKPKIIFSD